MSKRRRVIRKWMALILLGASINVAVAWSCAWFCEPSTSATSQDCIFISETANGLGTLTSGWGWREIAWYGVPNLSEDIAKSFSNLMPGRNMMFTTEPIPWWSDPPTDAPYGEYAFGWPLPSLWAREYVSFDRASTTVRFEVDPSTSMSVRKDPTATATAGFLRDQARYLAFVPIWLGFIGNTVLYALMLWMPLALFVAYRRRRERRKGLCRRCAYDLRGADHEVCPECGSPQMPRA